ncbi:DUF6160 family protein [Alcanivorax sp. DP30]|uniref:DUF6160 family protein n=1 Tax=Alcanivorax sp. DP30 TaxID=2606217 RepID=UPI0013679D5B|nr:DUF6160 family protein [Alcanivorax sp. DP30]MZR62995.1 hypothetical protein [Alcanivorax sp. DP30]
MKSQISLLLFTSCLPVTSLALQAMDDSALSGVTGADGVSVSFNSTTGISAERLEWITDDDGLNDGSCTGGISHQHACTQLQNIALQGVGGALNQQWHVDVGSDGSGNPYLGLSGSWDPQQLEIGGLTFETAADDASTRSLGSLALISSGQFALSNRGGPFNAADNFAALNFSMNGDLFYRQGGPGSAELSFANLFMDTRFTNGAAAGQTDATGRIGIDGQGLVIDAPFAELNLGFDLAFKAAATDYDQAGRSNLLRFGWQGGLVNPVWRLTPGGFGYNTYLNGADTYQDFDGSQTGQRSQGISLYTAWDFDSDFSLSLGEAGGNGTVARFSNWQRLGTAPGPMFALPIIFDVFQGGVGPAGLCAGSATSGVIDQTSCTAAGGEWYANALPGADEAAFGILMRDGRLLAYNTLIEVEDPLAGGTVTPVDWGAAFTFGKLDADIFLYPYGRADGATVTTTDTGIRADINLVAQSPDAWRRANSSSAAVRATSGNGWQTNTHFMMVDTQANTGVGFINGDIIYQARDLFLRVTHGDSRYPDLPGGLWLQTDNLAQYRFRALFGGGSMDDLSYDALTKVSLIDVNLETDQFLFALNPLPVDGATGAAPIGFNGLLDLDGSYLRVGEISSPQSQFFVNDVSGRVAWRDGSIAMVSGQHTADGLPQLAISNDLDIGESAHFGGAPGDPLIGTIGFGSEAFGRMVIPAGSWHSDVILKIP